MTPGFELGDTHAVIQRHRFRSRKDTRCFNNQRWIVETADVCYVFRCVFFQNLSQFGKSFATCFDILPVLKSFFQNHVHQAIQDRDIRSGSYLQKHIGVLCQFDPTWIRHHKFFPRF